uniref:Odorant receptor n=1 Tax=Culicoides sonorensis TaxID=179676 RepID=A0A336MIW5_CULSO
MRNIVKRLLNDWPVNQLLGFMPLQRLELLSLGAWPRLNPPTWYVALGYFNSLFNGMCVAAEFSFAFENTSNLQLILDSLCPAFTKMCIAIKLFFIVWRRNEFYKILKELSDYYMEMSVKDDIEFIKRLAVIAFKICFILTVFSEMTGVFFDVLPVSMNIYRILTGQETIAELPFRSIWPWKTSETPGYEITYLLLVYSSWLTSTANPGLDCTFMGICFHISTEFQSIKSRFIELGKEIDKRAPNWKVLNNEDNKYVYNEFKRIIEKHTATIELCETSQKLSQEMILIHFITSAMVICMNGVNLIIASGAAKSIYVCYIMTALIQAFVFCYGGDSLEQSSRELNTELYKISWHKLNGNGRRAVLMMIQRTQKTVGVAVPFFHVSMPTFANVRCFF